MTERLAADLSSFPVLLFVLVAKANLGGCFGSWAVGNGG